MVLKEILNQAEYILEQCARGVDENGVNDFLDGQMKTAEVFRQMAIHGLNSKINDAPNPIHWLTTTEELPEHSEVVLTYTPPTEISEEQVRLIKYGSLKNGFPPGVTFWVRLTYPPCKE